MLRICFRDAHFLKMNQIPTCSWIKPLILSILIVSGTFLGATTDCPEPQRPITDRDEGLSQMLETYKPQLDLIVPKVLHAAHKSPNAVKFCYSKDEGFFSVYADGAGNNVVHVNLGGLQPIDISADAFGFATIDLRDSGWWFNYLLYLRSLRHQGPVSVEPQEIAGFSICDMSDEANSMRAQISGEMIAFVIAHELGHVALKHNGIQRKGENKNSYNKRRQRQELAADKYAAKILRRGETDSAPILLLLTHLIIDGDREHMGSGTQYPSDSDRIGQLVKLSRHRGSQEEFVAVFAHKLSELFPPGASETGYDALDYLSEQTTLSTLKVDPSKVLLHPSQRCKDLMPRPEREQAPLH
jgi:IrrE N-terminal-like domain